MKEIKIEKNGKCKVVFIPKGYCTINLEDIDIEDVEISKDDGVVCIEILDMSFECFGKKQLEKTK